MVNFRIYNNFNYFITYEEIDWDSLGLTIFLGRYIRDKSTGISYFVRRLSQSFIQNKGYIIVSSSGTFSSTPDLITTTDLKTVFLSNSFYKRRNSEPNLVTDILFRNLNDYQRAVKELKIDQTKTVNIPYSFQIKPDIPKIQERFESLFNTSKVGVYLYY